MKFAHKRITNPDGTLNAKGGATIAYEQAGSTISYAVARCHEKDNFVKSQGRVKSAGRLLSPKHYKERTISLKDFKELIYNTPLMDIRNL